MVTPMTQRRLILFKIGWSNCAVFGGRWVQRMYLAWTI
jgi:hypothetical protein